MLSILYCVDDLRYMMGRKSEENLQSWVVSGLGAAFQYKDSQNNKIICQGYFALLPGGDKNIEL